MAGCVSVTACCNNVDPTSALLCGIVGAAIYKSTVVLFYRLEIDDPLQVSQIHGFCGLWGVLAVGIFDQDRGVIVTGQFKQIGIQTVGVIALMSWNFLISFTFFKLLKILNRLRVGQVFELYGMDILENADLVTKDSEITHSLQLNYSKLTKLETRQRRRAKDIEDKKDKGQL